MEPKTKRQKKVYELFQKLKPISEKKKQWGYEKCLDSYYVISRKTIFCLECGHNWKTQLLTWQETVCGVECPECKKKLKEIPNYSAHTKDSAYFGILTTVKNYQVFRIFILTKYMKKKEKSELYCSEVMQHWIENDGYLVSFSRKVQGMSRYYDQWIAGSELTVQAPHFKSAGRYSIIPYKIYPERKILPEIKRNGFKGNFHNFIPQELMSLLLRNSKAETLIKAGQFELLKKLDRWENSLDKWWPSIKICIRNNYIVKDAGSWLDYLQLLESFGKDLLNTRYICPTDLKREHDRYVEKRRERDRKRDLIETLRRMEEDQLIYAEQKKNFMNLEFQKGNIRIVVLKSVYDFKECSDILRHCIFTNKYHRKEKSLLFKAEVDGEIVEAIEVSLEEMKILQARGRGNKGSKFNKEIVSLMNSNMKQIARVHKQKKKTKTVEELPPAIVQL